MHLSDISGIGLKTIKYLNNLGIYTIDDLVSYYPYRYEIIKRSDLNSINIGDKVIIDGVVEVLPNISYYGKRKNSMSFRINAVSRILSITIYGLFICFNSLITLSSASIYSSLFISVMLPSVVTTMPIVE